MLASMYMAALPISGPVAGLLMVISMTSRPSKLLPIDASLRNLGKAAWSVFMSASSSAVSCQRSKSSLTLKAGSDAFWAQVNGPAGASIAAAARMTDRILRVLIVVLPSLQRDPGRVRPAFFRLDEEL